VNVALRPQRLDFISLCTGGGGLDLAVELAIPDARAILMVEREAFAVAHLVSAMESGLMAPAPVWSDVRTLDGRPWRGLVDGVIGGIPCQPHSLAGKRLGRDDPRDLWSAARRIIVQSGAWWCLIENVRGMLSSGGAERVIRDLERLGFAAEPGLFTAAETGAAIRRERIFILAVSDNARREGSIGEGQQDQARSGGPAPRRQSVRPTGRLGPPGPDQVSLIPRDPDALAGRILRHRHDALRMLGNGVVPLEGAYALRTLASRLAASGSAGAARLVRMMGDV
jgi:DNA (cytosine-5)-methyltransferase 1